MELSARADAALPIGGSGGLPARYIAAVCAGNALGFYDFLVFSFFAVQISNTIFPKGDETSALLATLATFWAGFLTRPIGALVLGRLGDRIGRKPAMMVSLTLTGAAVLAQSLIPSYAAIGVAAPVLILAARLAVGFGLGGEVGPSTAFLVEAAPVSRRGFYVSLQFATQNLAVLAAGVAGFVLANAMSDAALNAYGWRIAFALGAAAVPLALYIRSSLPETLDVEELHPSPAVAHHAQRSGGWILRTIAFVLLATGSIAAYGTIYLTTYAQNTLKMAADIAFDATIVLGLTAVICDLLAGWLSDRFGRRPVMVAAGAVLVATIFPAFLYLEATRTLTALILVSGFLGGLFELSTTPALVAITESLPKATRSTALAIVYALAISMFGGSTQFVITQLIVVTSNPLAPAWYLTAAQIVWLTAAFMLIESAPARLKAAVARVQD